MAVVTNYTTLLTAVADYLARSDLTSFIPNFVQNWEERFLRESDNWGSWMETALNVTITNGLAAVPADYLGLKVAYISGQLTTPLKRISLDQMYQRFPRASSGGGPAAYIARNGANFIFGPTAASGTLVGTYYAKPTVLRTDADGSNFLTTDCPDLCIYGALLEAEPFLKNDKRLATWSQMYSVALDAYRSRMRAEDYSGSPPHTVVV
jgi:hypothetical protein